MKEDQINLSSLMCRNMKGFVTSVRVTTMDLQNPGGGKSTMDDHRRSISYKYDLCILLTLTRDDNGKLKLPATSPRRLRGYA